MSEGAEGALAEPGPRLVWLDSLRLLGVSLVVLQHACTTGWMAATGIVPAARAVLGIASAGVPLLVVCAGYASSRSASFSTRDPRALAQRVVRLAIPYVAWTAAFWLAFTVLPLGQPVHPKPLDLFTGTNVYVVLWFLPMLIYVSILGWTLRTDRARAVAAALSMVVFAGTYLFPLPGMSWFAILVRYVLDLSLWAALYLLGQLMGSRNVTLRRRASRIAVTVAALAAGALAAWIVMTSEAGTFALGGMVHPIATGVLALCLLALAAGSERFRLLPLLGQVTLGIFLMHLPLLSALGRLAPAGIVPWYVWVPLNVATTVAVTGAVSLALARTRLAPLVS